MSSLAELEYTRDRLLGDLGNLHVEANMYRKGSKKKRTTGRLHYTNGDRSFLTDLRPNGLSYRAYKICSCMNMTTLRIS